VRTGQFRDIEETKYQIWPKDGDDVNESTLHAARR
jgi:hypothetical protein